MRKKNTTGLLLLALLAFATGCNSQKEQAEPKQETLKTQTMSKEEAIQLVKPFYDFLGGDATAEQVQPSYHDDWKSYYDNSGARTMEETVGFVSGPLSQMIPDLKWRIVEVYTNENTIIVRGEATGTPAGEAFMGSPIPGGKSFQFMSIDIHELADGKIKRTYHVEDWLSAIRQVSAN